MTHPHLPRTLIYLVTALLLVGAAGPGRQAPKGSARATSASAQVARLLRGRLAGGRPGDALRVDGDSLRAAADVRRFYVGRAYRPAWIGPAESLSVADTLVRVLRMSDRDGLDPDDYHLPHIELIRAAIRADVDTGRARLRSLVDLDLLLSDAFFAYGSHLLYGRVDPQPLGEGQIVDPRGVNMPALLQTAIRTGRVRDVLASLAPRYPGYARLQDALARYRELAQLGGWPTVPNGLDIGARDRDPRVPTLRTRLRLEGDLSPDTTDDQLMGQIFDYRLDRALRAFQECHGIDPDGVLGRETLAKLNVPVEERMAEIETNLERLRWLPRNPGIRYLLVNIAGFELSVIDSDTTAMWMRVVVGTMDTATPAFSDTITQIVLNPDWHIPRKIALQDILPRVLEDSSYLASQHMRMYRWTAKGEREVDPRTIDWASLNADKFPYVVVQDPGADNALGRIKFVFPNPYAVYLHDTPSGWLFDSTVRTFSHGCIRIERPLDLATYLMQDDPTWTRDAFQAAIDTGEQRIVRLRTPVPVHLVYWTVWVDEDGTLQFRDDIYDRDTGLAAALH